MNAEPSVLEVATIIRARTRGMSSGMEEGTFNANTNPTAAQAEEQIAKAASEVTSDLGTENIPESVVSEVKSLISLLAASYIEMSYYPEQVATNSSPYKILTERYEKRLPRTVRAVERALEGDTEDTAVELLPQYGFPSGADPQGMIGWGTVME